MNMYEKKWMSGIPEAVLRFTTRGTGSAAISVFKGAVGSIPQSQSICLSTISCTANWDKARFLKWASGIGEATRQVVLGIFDSYRIEEQAYKGCLSLLKLADKYTPERLEHACRAALERIPSPRYKNIRLILESGNDRAASSSNQSSAASQDENYALVRGTSYYGGGSHEK